MRNNCARIVWLLCVPLVWTSVDAKDDVASYTSESVLRKLVAQSVLPVYPRHALPRGACEVAVARVEMNGQGVVSSYSTVEAPNSTIERALSDAVAKWRFHPPLSVDDERRSAYRLSGLLTFYFIANNDDQGNGLVFNAPDAPTDGRCVKEQSPNTKGKYL